MSSGKSTKSLENTHTYVANKSVLSFLLANPSLYHTLDV